MTITFRPGLWIRFVQFEKQAAAAGSGLTRDQMTGAVVFLAWMEEHGNVRADIEAELIEAVYGVEWRAMDNGRVGVEAAWLLRLLNDPRGHKVEAVPS